MIISWVDVPINIYLDYANNDNPNAWTLGNWRKGNIFIHIFTCLIMCAAIWVCIDFLGRKQPQLTLYLDVHQSDDNQSINLQCKHVRTVGVTVYDCGLLGWLILAWHGDRDFHAFCRDFIGFGWIHKDLNWSNLALLSVLATHFGLDCLVIWLISWQKIKTSSQSNSAVFRFDRISKSTRPWQNKIGAAEAIFVFKWDKACKEVLNVLLA